ncbi:MAG: PQQ-binding-like beta-propeller repeat protein [Verrucomicrobia bacterium]|nr:PQQ-binding-like beta-propeller repeat protein [Verrucomicrobiota bacterium]
MLDRTISFATLPYVKATAYFLSLGFFFSVITTSALAANWPGWRGPTGYGITTETNLPTKWSDTENVRWKVKLPNRGNSTPIVWGKKVFVSQPIEDENRRTLICFDRATGKQLWQSGTVFQETETSHRTNPVCSPSPTTDGKRVIAWFGSAGVFCYDMDGKQLWHRDLGKQSHEWGYAASPVIYGDLCILNFGPGERSFLVALDKKTGKTVWQVDLPQVQPKERTDGFAGDSKGIIGSWSTPIIVKTNGRDELVLSLAEWLKGFDPKTGKELWRVGGLNPLLYTSPIYGDGIVVAMGGFHGTTIAAKPGGTGDVTDTHRLWQKSRTKNRLSSGVIHNGYLYVPNTPGIAECIELATGKTIWDERLPGIGAKTEFWSSMVLAGDKIYIVNQSGDCVILRASPNYEILGVNAIGSELTNGSLAVSDGDLFIRTHEHLWCISETKR